MLHVQAGNQVGLGKQTVKILNDLGSFDLLGSDATSQQEFTSCLKETLSGLAKNATDLQNSGMSEEELTKAMEGLGMDEGEGEGNILPIMQSIMQNLLSKDVLYPSLREITEKYPEWLQSHQESLPPEQFEKYQKQHSVMGKICEQFEAETPADSEATQKARFETVLDLMQQLQDLGHPPKELAGEMPPGLNFDLDALNLSGPPGANGEQCLIMWNTTRFLPDSQPSGNTWSQQNH